MPYIEIIEKDETSAGVLAESTDVVYIPGFVDISQPCLNKDDKYVGIEKNKPTLFTSVKQFESLCGKCPAEFESDQYYSDLQELVDGTYTGFSSNAIPYHRVMFNKGMGDPSYLMAKEYLNAGLNVLYERVNSDSELIEVTEEPKDELGNSIWSNTYKEYFAEQEYYEKVSDPIPPAWYELVPQGATVTADTGKYFEAVIDNETDKITSFVPKTFTADKDGSLINTETVKEIYVRTKDYYSCTVTKSKDTQGNDVENKEYNCVTMVDDVLQVMPDDWVKTYFNHYEKLRGPKQITETKVPSFDSFKYVDEDGKEHSGVFKKDAGITIKNMYNALEGVFDSGAIDGLADKGNYSIKYLTSGGYPTYEYTGNSITTKMIALAVERGDCVAIIDHTDNPYRDDNIDHIGSLYKTVIDDQVFKANGDFATMFTPWAAYNRTTTDKEFIKDDNGNITEKIMTSVPTRLPASFAYLIALGDSIRTNANWLAIAGSARGVVLNLATDGMTTNIPNGAADAMQPRDGVAVNAITNIKPYGWTIWGNRTLKNNGEKGNLTATSFLNVRNLISDVKKLAYRVARQLTFEQNNDILWVNFKGLIAPTLDRMLSGYGISGYKIVRDTEHEKASEKATVCAKIILYPVYPVEDFYITIVLKDDEISVE